MLWRDFLYPFLCDGKVIELHLLEPADLINVLYTHFYMTNTNQTATFSTAMSSLESALICDSPTLGGAQGVLFVRGVIANNQITVTYRPYASSSQTAKSTFRLKLEGYI